MYACIYIIYICKHRHTDTHTHTHTHTTHTHTTLPTHENDEVFLKLKGYEGCIKAVLRLSQGSSDDEGCIKALFRLVEGFIKALQNNQALLRLSGMTRHAAAYVSIRQHTYADVCLRMLNDETCRKRNAN